MELHDLLRSLAKSHVLCRIDVLCRIGVCSLVIQAVLGHVTVQDIWQMLPVQLVHRIVTSVGARWTKICHKSVHSVQNSY